MKIAAADAATHFDVLLMILAVDFRTKAMIYGDLRKLISDRKEAQQQPPLAVGSIASSANVLSSSGRENDPSTYPMHACVCMNAVCGVGGASAYLCSESLAEVMQG